nr:unnamed protein product [Spirometra erinaceieuropaei]
MSNRKRAFLISGCVYFVLFECLICGVAFNSERKSYPIRNFTTLRRTYRSLGEVGSSGEVVCEAKGRGTSEFLSCPQKTCRANVDCWVAYGKPQQCVCDPQFCGLVCLPVGARCPPPYRPSNGFVSYRDSKVGDTAEYSCAPGFTVMGPRKRHCLGTMQWSGPEPICTNQTDYCFSPPYIQNTIVLEHTKFGEGGSHEKNDYRTGDSITMTCRSGFEDPTRKYTTVLCVGNQWKYEKLDCQRISCPEIDGPVNGRTIYTSDLRYRATAVQFCNDGHAIKCHDDSEGVVQREEESCMRVCQADGRWSGSNAECTPIQCPQLQKPEHGSLSGFWTKVNSVVAFECEIGYELIGSPFRRCQLDGKWDGDPVVCKSASAFETADPLLTFAGHISSVNLARCHQCLPQNWSWRGRKPECVPIHCKRPVVMDGVQIHLIGARGRWPFESDSIFPTHGAVVVYSCVQEGYRINGPRYSFCIEVLVLTTCAAGDTQGGQVDGVPHMAPSSLYGGVFIWGLQIFQALDQVTAEILFALRLDTGCSAAELVFGVTVQLPGEMVSPTLRGVVEENTNLVHRLRQFIRTRAPVPSGSYTSPSHLDKDWATCSHVYLRCDRVRRPLEQPYDGPFRVRSRGTKTFRIQRANLEEFLSVERPKASLPDFPSDEACGHLPAASPTPQPLFRHPVFSLLSTTSNCHL